MVKIQVAPLETVEITFGGSNGFPAKTYSCTDTCGPIQKMERAKEQEDIIRSLRMELDAVRCGPGCLTTINELKSAIELQKMARDIDRKTIVNLYAENRRLTEQLSARKPCFSIGDITEHQPGCGHFGPCKS